MPALISPTYLSIKKQFYRLILPLFLLIFMIGCNSGEPTVPTPTLSPVETQGKSLFQLHCATCHAVVPDVAIVGPTLAGIPQTALTRQPDQPVEAFIRISILKPELSVLEGFPDAMPKDFGKKLTGEELDAIVAYLFTLQTE